jgi:hypothetical protein
MFFSLHRNNSIEKIKTSHKYQVSNDPKLKLKRLDDKLYNDYKNNL